MACITVERWPHWIDWFPDDYDIFLANQIGKCPNRGHLTKEEFLKWFPQFKDAPEERIEMLLEKCRRAAFNARIWGPWLKWGEALFVAHYLSLWELTFPAPEDGEEENGGGGWGVITSHVSSFQAGSVRYTKDTSMDAKLLENPYLKTIFGQKLMDLISNRIAIGLVTVT